MPRSMNRFLLPSSSCAQSSIIPRLYGSGPLRLSRSTEHPASPSYHSRIRVETDLHRHDPIWPRVMGGPATASTGASISSSGRSRDRSIHRSRIKSGRSVGSGQFNVHFNPFCMHSASIRFRVINQINPSRPIFSMYLFPCNALSAVIRTGPYCPYLFVFRWPAFGIKLANYSGAEVKMKVVCAWCEQEGKETLIGEIGLYDRAMTSNGICDDHEKALLTKIRKQRNKQNPRRRRRLPSRPQSRSSNPIPSLRTICIRTPTRRRLLEAHLSSAQLFLPFNDF